MKMVPIALQIPKEADDFFRKEAERRMISKSAVMREVLCNAAARTLRQQPRLNADLAVTHK
jgi:hypothetical protein